MTYNTRQQQKGEPQLQWKASLNKYVFNLALNWGRSVVVRKSGLINKLNPPELNSDSHEILSTSQSAKSSDGSVLHII